jgi:hypothetical protein
VYILYITVFYQRVLQAPLAPRLRIVLHEKKEPSHTWLQCKYKPFQYVRAQQNNLQHKSSVYLIHSHDSIYIAVEFIALELHIIQNLRGKRDEGYSIYNESYELHYAEQHSDWPHIPPEDGAEDKCYHKDQDNDGGYLDDGRSHITRRTYLLCLRYGTYQEQRTCNATDGANGEQDCKERGTQKSQYTPLHGSEITSLHLAHDSYTHKSTVL